MSDANLLAKNNYYPAVEKEQNQVICSLSSENLTKFFKLLHQQHNVIYIHQHDSW